MDAKTDVSVSDLQNRIRISEFHADTDVKADTICICRRYFSLPRSRPPCSSTRAAAAALFAVSRAESPPSRRARAKIRPCAPLLTHHPAIPIQSFYSPVLKFHISTLAARPPPYLVGAGSALARLYRCCWQVSGRRCYCRQRNVVLCN